jgi:hypothetical protein
MHVEQEDAELVQLFFDPFYGSNFDPKLIN